jgi:hypothetical protein
MRGPASDLSQQAGEAEGSLTLGAQGRAGAALTTTRQAGTARQLGLGKRDGKVYERRNQWWNLRKARTDPKPGGHGSGSGARRRGNATPTPKSIVFVGEEAMGNACGVPMARPPEKSWTPPPSIGTW